MPVEFLTDAKAGAYGRFPATVSDAQLAEYFHAAADEEAILERRMDHNRLGFAIQLGTVRFLGTFVADPAHVPRAVVEHVAAQLGIDDLSALERYWGTVKLTDLRIYSAPWTLHKLLILRSSADRFRLQNPRTLLNLTVPPKTFSMWCHSERSVTRWQPQDLRRHFASEYNGIYVDPPTDGSPFYIPA